MCNFLVDKMYHLLSIYIDVLSQPKHSDDDLIIQRIASAAKMKENKQIRLNHFFTFFISVIRPVKGGKGKLKHLNNVMSEHNLHFQISLMTSQSLSNA